MRSAFTSFACGCLLVMAAWSSAARADAVPPPPDDCLPGTQPETCHGGPHCLPKLCASDADCAGLGPCKSAEVCVAEISCDGMRPMDAPPPPLFKVVRGACGAACEGRCERLSYCGAKPPSILGLFGFGGSGCAGGGGGSGAVGLGVAIAVLVMLARRRGRGWTWTWTRAGRAGAVAGFVVGGMSAGGAARADVIPGPPASCPAGATPDSCHGGQYCAITVCDAAKPCPDGQRCAEVEGCFRKLNCAGDVNPEELHLYDRWSYDGACDPKSTCCSKQSMCVAATTPKSDPTPPTTATGRSACAGGDAGDLGVMLAVGALAVLGLRRMRRRRA